MARTQQYTDEYVITEVINKLKEHKIIRICDVFKHTKFGSHMFYKRKLQNTEEIKQILEDNNIEYKENLIINSQDEIKELVKKSIKLCKSNPLIFRIDFLCCNLKISCRKFYDLEINRIPEVREALNDNKLILKQKTYADIFSSVETNANKLKLSLVGDEEERQKISTSYQKIDSKIDANVKTKSKMTKLVIIQKPEKKK